MINKSVLFLILSESIRLDFEIKICLKKVAYKLSNFYVLIFKT